VRAIAAANVGLVDSGNASTKRMRCRYTAKLQKSRFLCESSRDRSYVRSLGTAPLRLRQIQGRYLLIRATSALSPCFSSV